MDILLNYEQEANEKNYQFASNLYIENNLVVKKKQQKNIILQLNVLGKNVKDIYFIIPKM